MVEPTRRDLELDLRFEGHGHGSPGLHTLPTEEHLMAGHQSPESANDSPVATVDTAVAVYAPSLEGS